MQAFKKSRFNDFCEFILNNVLGHDGVDLEKCKIKGKDASHYYKHVL